MIDTCEALEWEIVRKASQLTSSGKEAFEKFDRELRQRSAFHVKVNDPIRSGHLRSVTLSVSTLIAYNDDGNFYLWLQRRSSSVATHPSFLHIIPSCTFQPTILDQRKEAFSVEYNAWREYLEELFSDESEKTAIDWRFIDGDPRLHYLKSLLKTGKAEFYFSGVAVSPLNFRPEISTVLLIRSAEWYKRHIHGANGEKFNFNMEWESPKNDEAASGQRSIVRIPFKDTTTDEELEEWIKKEGLDLSKMVPVGAGSFWLGIDLLRHVKMVPEL